VIIQSRYFGRMAIMPVRAFTGKDFLMPGQILYLSRPVTVSGGAAATRFPSLSGTSASRGLPSKSNMETQSPASAAGLGCVRGTTLALMFEAVMAILIYTAWHFLRLLH
jgi:hypothetical protein